MSRTARRLTRILSMVPWVIAHQGASVREVCERFGYTERELLEDLNLVFVCGLPGYGPGDLMVAYVENDEVIVDMAEYFSRPFRLTPAEALGLLASGSALVSTSQAPEGLEQAVGKLASALGIDPDETVVVDLAGESALVAVLRRGVSEQRVVSLTYTSLGKGETRERLVEPWSVFSTLGNWYLSGFCRTSLPRRPDPASAPHRRVLHTTAGTTPSGGPLHPLRGRCAGHDRTRRPGPMGGRVLPRRGALGLRVEDGD